MGRAGSETGAPWGDAGVMLREGTGPTGEGAGLIGFDPPMPSASARQAGLDSGVVVLACIRLDFCGFSGISADF